MAIEIKFYETEVGVSPFDEWLDTLTDETQARVIAAVERFEAGNFGDVKPVGEGVSERRLDFGPGYRVYFGRDGQRIVILLTGGTKKRQQRDIDTAKQLWADYKRRKRAANNKRKKGS